MHIVRAILAVALFSWLSFAVLTDTLPGSDGGSSKTRELKGLVDSATAKFGLLTTSVTLFMTGILLAFIFLMWRRRNG